MPIPVPRSKVSPPKSPQSDPKFQRVTGRVNSGATRLKQHPPPRTKAVQAQAAAVPPAKERLAGAQAKQVDKMQQAKPKPVEPNGFLVALRAEIEKVMPQNLDEADKFMEGGEQQQMKDAVTGKVGAQKDAATGDVKSSTKQAPDVGGVPAKQVTPIPGEPVPPAPQINAAQGMPSAKPDAEVTQKEYKDNADQQLKDAEVTPTQLKKANDPRFSAVLTAKEQVEKLADAGPAKYRASEKGTLAQAVVRATGDARQGAAALVGIKNRSGVAVRARQNAAKERDEKRRREVTETIEGIYNSTKASVEAKLNGLETQVVSQFDAGASAAIAAMKANSKREIEAFKDERYSGVRGKARWLADLFRPVPQGIKDILARNRQRFTQDMDRLIVSIATIVDARLREAKREIDKGQTKTKAYVASLPRDLQAVGRAAEQEVGGRFDELRRSVDDKKNDLAQKLAQKYKEASDKADAELKKIEEENAGALRGLIDKLAEIVKILSEFKDKLMSLLRKGMATIKLIIADPIGFLGNLISAIKQGIQQFKANFFKHLQDAFIKWLFGAMAGAGVQLPANLSLPEILKFVLSVLGITYERMRQKAVKLLGPTAVAIIEKVVEYVKALIQGGPAALWEKVKEDLSNLKAMVIDAIISWVTETIVKQAVAKIVSMFNPAGAIIQAIIAIYNVVMFVVERASQIMAFVEAVINSVHSIATGAIGGAAAWIEKSLAGALVLVISFLARLIGLGGISQKIKEFIQKVQNVVDKAIDKAIGKVVAVVRKLFGQGKTAQPGSAQEKLDKGMAAARSAVDKFSGKVVSVVVLKPILAAIRVRYGLKTLEATKEGGKWAIRGMINPSAKLVTEIVAEGSEDEDLTEQELMDMLLGTSAPIQEREPDAPPQTRISESSITYTVKVIGTLIQVSPASEVERNKAMDFLIDRAQVAYGGSDGHAIYKALQQAGGRIKRLYSSGKSIVQIHHEQEVAEHPETFPETRRERVAIPKNVERQLQSSIKQIQKKYSSMKGKTKKEKKELANRDITELRELIKDSLLDWKSSRKRDEKGRRTQASEPAVAPAKPLEEIDLIALPVKAHIEVHRRRKK